MDHIFVMEEGRRNKFDSIVSTIYGKKILN